MSLTAQNLLSNTYPRLSVNYLKTHNPSLSISRKDSIFSPQFLTFSKICYKSLHTLHGPVRVFKNEGDLSSENGENSVNLDNLLPVLEFICIASSAAISIGLTFNKWVFARFGNRVFSWQLGFLVGAVAIGAAIRERQWRRVCGFARRGSESVNLVERIEKLEEDVRSSVTIVRVLSRQLEKLGVRFRVTRRALKDPIAGKPESVKRRSEVLRDSFTVHKQHPSAEDTRQLAATLAQKNSEATRALAAQGDILEKELSEIQKVLLAMQEQQQKQLELILAIGKTGKLWDTKRGPTQEQVQVAPEARKPTEERPNKMVNPNIRALDLQKETNDRA